MSFISIYFLAQQVPLSNHIFFSYITKRQQPLDMDSQSNFGWVMNRDEVGDACIHMALSGTRSLVLMVFTDIHAWLKHICFKMLESPASLIALQA